MNLLKRLKNLWKLSEFEVPKIGERPEPGTFVAGELHKKKEPQGYVVKLKDDLSKIIEQQ